MSAGVCGHLPLQVPWHGAAVDVPHGRHSLDSWGRLCWCLAEPLLRKHVHQRNLMW
jgi:hypothetical protein